MKADTAYTINLSTSLIIDFDFDIISFSHNHEVYRIFEDPVDLTAVFAGLKVNGWKADRRTKCSIQHIYSLF